MRRPAAYRYIICACALVLLSPAALTSASEKSLGEMLTSTKSRLLQAKQADPAQMEAESSGEFLLGVRNRSAHERASGSSVVEATVSAPEPRPTLGRGYEPDYTVREWWHGASQTKKTGVIVGAAVVFLIIFK